MASVTIKQLLEAGVHFGHQTRRWNPAMEPYLYGERGGIHIIDLRKTAELIEEAYEFVRDTVAKGGTVLFVGTKKQVQAAVAEEATRAGMPYVNYRWLGGMLTNFQTIKKRIAYMKELERMEASGEMEALTKKERLRLHREFEKLQRNLGGVADLQRTPQAVFIVDTNIEHIALGEAKRLNIPVIALCDSNSDPSDVEFVVPGNDDAVRSAQLVASVVADACVAGRQQVDEAELAAKE
jgi:small subunit ribosomal protein S2